MLKKLLMLSTIAVLTVVLFTGCGGTGGFGGDPLRDKTATLNAVAQMKEKAGTPLIFFQHVNFNSESIIFIRQDQNNKNKVEKFMWYHDKGWQGPEAVELTGDGEIADNIFNADVINWEIIPDFVAAAEKRAHESGAGLENARVESLLIYYNGRQEELSLQATVRNEKKQAHVQGDVKTGAVTMFTLRNN